MQEVLELRVYIYQFYDYYFARHNMLLLSNSGSFTADFESTEHTFGHSNRDYLLEFFRISKESSWRGAQRRGHPELKLKLANNHKLLYTLFQTGGTHEVYTDPKFIC